MEKPMIDVMWVLLSAGLVFMMQAGFLCLETGLTRTKNAINVAIKNVTDFAVSVIIFWLIGFGIMFGTTSMGWVGTGHFFPLFGEGKVWLSTFFLFQVMFCATAATIVSGAVAERMRFGAYIFITVIITGLIYPFFGHWVWGGALQGSQGWLGKLGFIDFAGSSVVHSVGGWVALAALLVIGPRLGRYSKDGTPNQIPGNNIPMALLGTLILCFGWIGFNGGSTLAMNDAVPSIIVNTILAGSAGAIITLCLGWSIKKIPDVSFPINGILAGLVAITANCHAVNTISAIIIGAIGGLIAYYLDELFVYLKIDDVISAVPVHLGAGIWGTLAVAIFGNPEVLNTGLTRLEQLQIQFIGVIICGIYTFGVAYVCFSLINQFYKLRITEEQELIGLNVAEHNARSDMVDLLVAMDHQEKTKDMDFKVPEEPFTEVGQIANKYNKVMKSLKGAVLKTDAIVRNIQEGVISLTEEGVISTINPTAEKMFGYIAQDIIGKPISIIVRDELTHSTVSNNHNWKNWIGKRCEIQGIKKDKSWFPGELAIAKGRLDDQSSYTVIIRDMTRQREAENELKQKINDLQKFKNLTVGREEKMIELKNEINALQEELGKNPKYDLALDKLRKP